MKEAFGWDPKKVSAGSGAKRAWKCSNGHIFHSIIGNRTSLGTGCPSSTIYGFDPDRGGVLYLLRHDQWGMLQIGISNFPEDRLLRHKKLGWELLEVRGQMDGMIARKWEQCILSFLKQSGALMANNSGMDKFDGWTEAWVENTLKVSGLKQLMELVSIDENS